MVHVIDHVLQHVQVVVTIDHIWAKCSAAGHPTQWYPVQYVLVPRTVVVTIDHIWAKCSAAYHLRAISRRNSAKFSDGGIFFRYLL